MFFWNVVYRSNNVACVGERPWWPKYAYVGLVYHVDAGSWIPCGVAVICIFVVGVYIQHGPGSKWRIHAGQIRLSMYQYEARPCELFSKLHVGEVPLPFGCDQLLQISIFILKLKGALFSCFFNSSAVSRGKPIPAHRGKRENNNMNIAILEEPRLFHSGDFTST